MSSKNVNLYLGIPCYRGICESVAAQSIFELAFRLGQKRDVPTSLVQPTGTIAHTARQMCVDAFLGNPDATHLAFIDDDMIFTSDQFFDLLNESVENDLDYLSCLAFANMIPTKVCLFGRNPEKVEWGGEPWWHVITHPPKGKRFKVYATGFGMVILSRRLLEAMKESYGEKNFFQHKASPNEDIGFCLNVHTMGGFDIWADTRVCIGHISKERHIIGIDTYEAQGDAAEYTLGMTPCTVDENGVIAHVETAR